MNWNFEPEMKRLASAVRDRSARDHAKDLLATYILHEESGQHSAVFREGSAVALSFLSRAQAKRLAAVDPARDIWPLVLADETPSAVAAATSLPRWLVEKWTRQLCDPARSHGGLPFSEVHKLAESCNTRAPVTLRVNRLKLGGQQALVEVLAAEGLQADLARLCPWAVHLRDGRPPGGIWSLAAWRAGLFEVQDEGSQLIALSTEAAPGETVLDYCAGNGGKTLALAAMISNNGTVLAYDINAARLRQLEGSVGRAGATCVRTVTREQLEEVSALHFDAAGGGRSSNQSNGGGGVVGGKGGVDVVLVDAPCSSTGVLRRHPSLRWTLAKDDVAEFPALQLAILRNASSHVRAGGRLVYATCAINREENEEVADAFEAEVLRSGPQGGGFERWPFEARGSNRLALLPHVHGTDGFFIARWRRAPSAAATANAQGEGRAPLEEPLPET